MWFYKAVQLNITSLKSSGKPVATAQSQPGLRCGKFTPPSRGSCKPPAALENQ